MNRVKDNYLGARIPKLGFGIMRLPKQGEEVDMEHTTRMVDKFMENGFTYFDTAYVYINGTSEGIAKTTLVDRYPRDAFQLATKLPLWQVSEREEMDRILDQSLERAGVEYFDFYLLHGLNTKTSDKQPVSDLEKADQLDAWGFVQRKQREGKLKHIGFSFHDEAAVLDQILKDHPEMEFVQLQINYADWEDKNTQSRLCYEVAMKHQKPVIIMEPVKGGILANLRPDVAALFQQANPQVSPASWAIRYAASLEGVITVLSGMSNMEQMEDNIAHMKNFVPLDERERAVIADAVQALQSVDTIGCTACRYCVDDCPSNINIPRIFELVNDCKVYHNFDQSKLRYRAAVENAGKASACIACGSCEVHCPQKLPVIQLLKEGADLLEE